MTSIIIVTYNSQKTIGNLLTSIEANLLEDAYEVIVVDNKSSDNTRTTLKKFSFITTVLNNKNEGFSKACHAGVDKSRGSHLLFLNPDTLVTEDILKPVLPYFKDNTVGVVGIMIRNTDGTLQESVRSFPTLGSQLLIVFKLHYILPRLPALRKYYRRDFDYTKKANVEQVMGAAFFTTRDLWNTIGGFDKRFFVWYEEVDYCFQAVKRGFKIVYTPNVSIKHVRGHSFSHINRIRKFFWFIKSMIQYFLKNGL